MENDGVVIEEWVDDNVTSDPTVPNVDDDSVSDCCCDKRVTIDNGNWCIKLPRHEFTVRESIQFLDVLKKMFDDNLPHFGDNYDGFNNLIESIREYKLNAIAILYDNDCIEFTGDVDYHGDKI